MVNILAVTQFVSQFTHVLDVLYLKVEKNSLGKTVWKIWSHICERLAYLSTKVLLERYKFTPLKSWHSLLHGQMNLHLLLSTFSLAGLL